MGRKHRDSKALDPLLAEVVDHSYVLAHRGEDEDRPGCAGLWLIRKIGAMTADDLIALIVNALEEQSTPTELREMIVRYLLIRCGCIPPFPTLTKEEQWAKIGRLLCHASAS